MKKTRVLAIAAISMFTVLAMGCGKQKDNTDAQTDDNTVYKIQVDSIINRDNDLESEEADETIVEEPIKFSCMDEIKDAKPESGLVQIDDMIFQYGAKFSEIASVIEQSECTYEAEYNVSSVVPAGENLGIRFYKDGNSYFLISVENREAETIELKDCVVYEIRASDSSMGNAFYAGFNSDEMTYATVKDAMEDYEPEKEIFGSNAKGNKELGIMYVIPFQESEMYVYYIFDGITNELVTFQTSALKYADIGWPW